MEINKHQSTIYQGRKSAWVEENISIFKAMFDNTLSWERNMLVLEVKKSSSKFQMTTLRPIRPCQRPCSTPNFWTAFSEDHMTTNTLILEVMFYTRISHGYYYKQLFNSFFHTFLVALFSSSSSLPLLAINSQNHLEFH